MKLWLPQDQTYWYLNHNNAPRCLQDMSADVVIIGGGLAGLSAAHAFHKRGKKVILLERSYCGAGASGKSSGFITPNAELSFTDFAKQYGPDRAHEIWDFITSGVEDIRSVIDQYQLVCDYTRQDTMMLANTKRALKELEIEHTNLARYGYKTEFFTAEPLRRYIGSDGYCGAVSYRDTFAMDGYLYCQEFKKKLQQSGVVIYEETPALSIEDHLVVTPHATIRAEYIVVCTDHAMPELGVLTEQVYSAQTCLMICEQLSEEQVKALFPEGPLLVWDSEMVYNYFRLTSDNRLLVGGGSLFTAHAAKPIHNSWYLFNKLNRYIVKKFPVLADVQFQQMWPGLIGLSKDIAPIAGRDKDRPFLYYVTASAGLPIAAALGRYSAEHLIDGNTKLDSYFCPYRSFPIGGAVQAVIGKRLSFSLSNGIRKFFW